MAIAPLRLAALALVLSACTSKVGPTGEKLIPAEATMLVGFDVGRTFESEIFAMVRGAALRDPQFDRTLASFKDCNVDPVRDHLSLLVGTDGKDDAAIVATGTDIGDRGKLQCLADRLARDAKDGIPPFVLSDPAAPVLSEARAHAIIVDPRTVVFATRPWSGLVADRVHGKGLAAVDGPLHAQYARADRSATLWFAGRVPDKTASDLQSTLGQKLGEVIAAIDVSSGLRVDFTLGFPTVEAATAVHKQASESLSMAKAFLPMVGVSAKTAETIRVELAGSEFRFSFLATVDDIRTLTEKAGPMLNPPEQQKPSVDDERNRAAAQQVSMVEEAYSAYRRAHKPDACPDLAAMKVAGLLSELPLDPWGRQIVVVCPGHKGGVDVFSWGQDGQPGTPDDVRNWI